MDESLRWMDHAMDEATAEQREAWELAQIRQRSSRLAAKPIGSIVRRLMASSGYGETQAAEQLQQLWNQAVGPALAGLTRPGNVSRGALHVDVADSATMQEIQFRRKRILAALQAGLPSGAISKLKLRVGRV